MQYNKVEICGVNTAKLKVLKEAEKIELLKQMQAGDKSARDKLVNGNLRLVLSVIQRFTNRGENLDDLFQVGTIGLMKAIDNFDISQNVRFSTYAVPMIIGEVRRYLRDNNTLRVSRSMRDTAYHAMQVVIALEAIVEPVSLYEPVYSDGGDTIYVMDQVGGTESDSDWIDEIVIKETIQGLSPREKRILSLRFMQGKTQTEVAEEIGISQAQVSRLEKCALHKIKGQEK